MPGSVESQVAAHTVQIEDAKREVEKLRDRCHKLETRLGAVDLLKRMVEELNADLPNLARQAAREAVTEAHRRRHADTLANWRTYAAVFAAGAALASLIWRAVFG